MTRQSLLNLSFVLGVAVLSGCSTMVSPTHGWKADVTQPRYHADNRACSPANQPRRRFDGASAELVVYKSCMQGRGYEWVAL